MSDATVETLAPATEDLAKRAPGHLDHDDGPRLDSDDRADRGGGPVQLQPDHEPMGSALDSDFPPTTRSGPDEPPGEPRSLPRRNGSVQPVGIASASSPASPDGPTATDAAPVLPRATEPAPDDLADGLDDGPGIDPWSPLPQRPDASTTAAPQSVLTTSPSGSPTPSIPRGFQQPTLPAASPVPASPQPILPDVQPAVHLTSQSSMQPTLPAALASTNAAPAHAGPRPLPRARVIDPPSMVMPGAAWMIGRLFLTAALAGVAQLCWRGFQRGEPAMLSSELLMLAVLGVLGIAGTAWWAMSLTQCARRLRLSSIRPARLGLLWLAPVIWTVAGVFLLRVEVRAEVDPMPGIVALGFACALALPYVATTSVARSLNRARPQAHWWLTLYLVDLVTLGVAGVVLSSTVNGSAERVTSWQVVSSALGATASVAALLVTMMLAVGGPGLVRERIAMLENREAGLSGPTWFRTGFVPVGQSSSGAAAPRPLLRLTAIRRVALAALMLWSAAGIAAFGAAAAAPLVGWAPPEFAIDAVSLCAAAGAGVWAVWFGIWATAGVANARRVRLVGSVSPTVMVVMTMPMPVALVVAVRLGGEAGWTTAMFGIMAGHLLMIAACRVLGTVMSHVRGNPGPFRLMSIMFTLYTGLAFCAWLTVLPVRTPWEQVEPIHLIAAGHGLATALLAFPLARAMAAFDRHVAAAYTGRVSFRAGAASQRRRPLRRRRGVSTAAPSAPQPSGQLPGA